LESRSTTFGDLLSSFLNNLTCSVASVQPFLAATVSSSLLSLRVLFFASILLFSLPFAATRTVSGFFVEVLTITCGFSRGRFLLCASPFASKQDEDIERRDSLLMINFSGFVAILVLRASVVLPVICAPFVDSFDWLVFLVGVDCSGVLRDDSCSLAEIATTIFRDLSARRFRLPAEGLCRVVEFFPDESTLVCASPRFCGSFLASTGEDSAGDLLNLLHDCSCSLLVKRGLSLLVPEGASVLAI